MPELKGPLFVRKNFQNQNKFSALLVLTSALCFLLAVMSIHKNSAASAETRLFTSDFNKAVDTPDLTVQVASDLHLEFYREDLPLEDIIDPKAKVLALLGDIGIPNFPGSKRQDNFRKFLAFCAKNFEYVLFVSGNHEYYQGNEDFGISETDKLMQCICDEWENVFFLQKQKLLINNVRVLGATLWSHCPSESERDLEMFLNDYRLIHISGQRLKAHHTSQLHSDHVMWLEEEISSASSRSELILVLTHHTPSYHGTSDPVHGIPSKNNVGGYGFSSPLESLYEGRVHTWAFGHTHFCSNQVLKGTRLLSNQRGYAHEVHPMYRPDFTSRISPDVHKGCAT